MAVGYLTEHSAGSILRSSVQIYGRNFAVLMMIFFLPLFPLAILNGEAQAAGHIPLTLLGILLNLFVSFFAFAALTVAISDSCLGNEPSVFRSYRRVLGPVAGRLTVTYLWQIFMLMIGVLLLIIPCFIFFMWFLFAPTVSVLEGLRGRAALRRSKALGRGDHWRNFGILVLVSMVMVGVFVLLVILVMGIGVAVGFHHNWLDNWLARAAINAVSLAILSPLTSIAIVLLYYDLRVRKEAYDTNALTEELRR